MHLSTIRHYSSTLVSSSRSGPGSVQELPLPLYRMLSDVVETHGVWAGGSVCTALQPTYESLGAFGEQQPALRNAKDTSVPTQICPH